MTRGNALLLVIVLGIGANFQSGYHATALSSPTPFIKHFINSSWYERYEETPPSEKVRMIWSLIVSSYPVGGLFGSWSFKFIAGNLGRKKGVICGSCISIIAAIIMLTSKISKSFEMIIIARLLFGFGAGLGCCLHLTYLTEISPKNIRGRVTLTYSNFFSLGKVIGGLLGLSEIFGTEDLWIVALTFPACFLVAHVVVFPFFPESPRYLFIEKGDEEACRKALQSLWGPGDYRQEMDEMLVEQAAIEAAHPKTPLQLMKDRTVRWQLVTAVCIFLFNNLSGMFVIHNFSFVIFMGAGIPEDKIRYISLGLLMCEVIVSMSTSLLIDRFGRRPLICGGFGAMCCGWVLVTVLLNLKGSSSWVSYVSAALIILIIVFHSGGPGAATSPLIGELFVQSDRLAAFVIIGMLGCLGMAVLGFAFPFLIIYLGSYSFVLFACVCLLASLYTFFIVPETKGKTMLEIAEEFKAISLCRRSANNP
ncbi:solute carrier family 2, facilitated glucose transporter member 5-like [Salarias fasciatus]|uniref:solute carrier family 2, facilitated glucose transporter member 5-like n=1 Tax=Salarias fasciatus TaxID=181472 RepID=UPI00117705BA|nr:solute carrier family 2, facilitated glucose transporter member 5-like [Salarias fasciatus]